ncbi:hypothetical protein Bca101_087595 [Brassica carinata]
MSRKWLTDYPLSPRSGFELLAVKREGILPMISRWFAARSCKDQCEEMDKVSRKLSLISNHILCRRDKVLSFVENKSEDYRQKFRTLAVSTAKLHEKASFPDVAVNLCHRPLLVATRSMKVQDFGSVYLNASGKSCFMDLERSSSSPKKLHRRIETEAAPPTFSPRTPMARSPIRKSSQFTSALVIFLGDYCDCGPETRKVIDFLISLPEKHRSKPTSFSP